VCCRGNDRWRSVSNFVSGLVILFEGADVIVPNSALVAEKVTNWTPADHQRRLWCVAWFGGDCA